jgi:hypothetical protein
VRRLEGGEVAQWSKEGMDGAWMAVTAATAFMGSAA